jgi:hypothetical protein
MLRECFEHQHPEAYGRAEVAPAWPAEARASVEDTRWQPWGSAVPEEPMTLAGAWALP